MRNKKRGSFESPDSAPAQSVCEKGRVGARYDIEFDPFDDCVSLTVNLLHQTLSHLISRMRFPPGNLRMMSV